MSTALITHLDCLKHEPPAGHPEQVARLRVVLEALEAPDFASLIRRVATPAPRDTLLLAHTEAHLRLLEDAAPSDGRIAIDPDTHMSPGSLRAGELAAGAVVNAVDMVLDDDAVAAFCALRPPGHHAERERAMGFCFYSSAAIGALHALENRGFERVAIIDFDVHHGNGTQDVVQSDLRILYASSHQYPFYPGTGSAREIGVGNIVNLPLEAGTGSSAFRARFEPKILRAVSEFQPQLIIISAGFDAHRADPLAMLNLDEADFIWATDEICAIAANCCGGRVVSTLEGGYDLSALASSAAAHVKALMAHAARRSSGEHR